MSYLGQLLGWVALQAAWQTLAIAVLLALWLRALRNASAEQRCRCSALHLAAAVVALLLSIVVAHASVVLTPLLARADVGGTGLLAGLQDGTRPLVAIWLAGIATAHALLAVRLARLRRMIGAAGAVPGSVNAMVEELSAGIGLRRPPRVCCAEVTSPMVAGWPSAVLVVPRSFAREHPPEEMRALLAHELAHIKRRDFAINTLQLFAASLLWWHPGMWLLYRALRHERECAADERAIRIAGSTTALARGLYRLASASFPANAVGIAAHSSGLADRIARMSEPRNDRVRRGPWYPAGALVFLTVIAVAVSAMAPRRENITRAYAASSFGPSTVFTIHAHDPAGTFLVRIVRGRAVAVQIGQRAVPPRQVVQRGDRVTILGDAGRESFRFQVDPRGGLFWKARPRRA